MKMFNDEMKKVLYFILLYLQKKYAFQLITQQCFKNREVYRKNTNLKDFHQRIKAKTNCVYLDEDYENERILD